VLFITRIRLVDVRCFPGETVIDVPRPSEGKPSWTLILGDNGTGKTSLLRSIAMCLCDETGASGLLTELSGPFIHHGCNQAVIELHLQSDEGTEYTITTVLSKTDSGTEEVKQRTKPSNSFPRTKLFACGYGAAFGTIGSEAYEKYRLIDAVYTLFNYAARLQNPENALFRISHAGIPLDGLLERINRVLMLPTGSTRLDSSGLSVNGPWGDFVPVGALGDGYAAVIAWICDLLGWSLLATRNAFDTSIRGIVLLDEIEQHLHPSWQQRIVGLLADDFPGVQFLATTHAPLAAIGSAVLPRDCCKLVLLQHGWDGVTIRSGLEPPRGSRADQVLTSYLFGLPSTSSDDVIQDIQRYALLRRLDSPDDHTRNEIEMLRQRLTDTLGTPETELQRTVETAVRETLTRMAAEGTIETTQDHDALSFEIRQQLRDLFGSKGHRA